MARTPRVYKFAIGFFFLATCIYFIAVHKVIVAKKAQLILNSIRFAQQRIFPLLQPKTLSLCPETFAETEFAFVAMLSSDFHIYGLGAAKLGRTLRKHSNLDLIILELFSKPIPQDTRTMLRQAGWKTCMVSKINGPGNVAANTNRFLEASIYSKFHAWQLVEYSAILLLDLDIIATKDPSDIFTTHLPLMLRDKKSIGAVREHPLDKCYGNGPWNTYNAGVLLIKPNPEQYTHLINSIDRLPHNSALDAEQALINTLLKDAIFELPVTYNALTIIKACEPALWLEHKNDFKLMHYTVTKPWMYSARWSRPEDPFMCWFWRVEEFCMLWDMIDVRSGIQ